MGVGTDCCLGATRSISGEDDVAIPENEKIDSLKREKNNTKSLTPFTDLIYSACIYMYMYVWMHKNTYLCMNHV